MQFLAVGRDLICENQVASSADIRLGRNAKVYGLLSTTYNHGYLDKIGGDAHARHVIIDDHTTIVRGKAGAAWSGSTRSLTPGDRGQLARHPDR